MKVSVSQLIHIMNAASIMSACLGGMCEEAEKEWGNTVKGIDRFLDSNGIKRTV